jgi:hypothetical protein
MPGFLYSDDEEGAEISNCRKAEGLLKRSVERRSTGEDTIMLSSVRIQRVSLEQAAGGFSEKLNAKWKSKMS